MTSRSAWVAPMTVGVCARPPRCHALAPTPAADRAHAQAPGPVVWPSLPPEPCARPGILGGGARHQDPSPSPGCAGLQLSHPVPRCCQRLPRADPWSPAEQPWREGIPHYFHTFRLGGDSAPRASGARAAALLRGTGARPTPSPGTAPGPRPGASQ